jgi:hypothetical protein
MVKLLMQLGGIPRAVKNADTSRELARFSHTKGVS